VGEGGLTALEFISVEAHIGFEWTEAPTCLYQGETQERGIVGEIPNLAARLQGIAEPNIVVICDSTPRLVGNLFELARRAGIAPRRVV
jgi:hypothetical protein